MHLLHVQITSLRGFDDVVDLSLSPDVTVLAGRNNTGKTTVLRTLADSELSSTSAVQLELVWQMSRQEFEQMTYDQSSVDVGLDQEELFRLRVKYGSGGEELPQLSNGVPVKRDRTVGHYANQPIELELLNTPFRTRLYQLPTAGAPALGVGWADEPSTNDNLFATLLAGATALRSRLFYVDPQRVPDDITPYNVQLQVASNGSNLAQVVTTLWTTFRYTIFAQLNAALHSAFPEIIRIEPDMTPGMTDTSAPQCHIRVRMFSEDGPLVPLSRCGTGVGQVLALTTVILCMQASVQERWRQYSNTPAAGPYAPHLVAAWAPILLIDEPHAFLHPYAERRLIQFIADHSDYQYLVATHSGPFLNTYPLSQTLLLTTGPGGARVLDPTSKSQILEELGVVPGDLWSPSAILWVEGPTEVAILTELLALEGSRPHEGVKIAAMPNWMRNASRSARTARNAVEFCDSVSAVVSPLQIPTLFLFDRDEKTAELMAAIDEATLSRARYLPVREIENLFLHAGILHSVIQDRCRELDLRSPSLKRVRLKLRELINGVDDRSLYVRLRSVEQRPDETRISGSEVLIRAFWDLAQLRYDKVSDGTRLTTAGFHKAQKRLQYLLDVLAELDIRS